MLEVCPPCTDKIAYAQYTPPTPTRRNCRVASRRRCVHEFATSWRQFRRVVGVNTPVGSRLRYCKLGHSRRLRCAFASPNPLAVVANSCTHCRRRRDATKQFCRVGVGGVYWALDDDAILSAIAASTIDWSNCAHCDQTCCEFINVSYTYSGKLSPAEHSR